MSSVVYIYESAENTFLTGFADTECFSLCRNTSLNSSLLSMLAFLQVIISFYLSRSLLLLIILLDLDIIV